MDSTQSNPSAARYTRVALPIILLVGPIAYFWHGSFGLAWSLGFGLAAGIAATLQWNAVWGLVWGLSAGFSVAIGSAGLIGDMQGTMAGGLFWGALGGFFSWRLWAPSWPLKRIFSAIFYGSLIVPIFGGLAAALMGLLLPDANFTGAAFILGVFLGLSWGLGGMVGILLCRFSRSHF